MKSDQNKQDKIRAYLLGQASPEDSSWLEEELLTDSDLLQQLLIAEDELIDQYLSEKLTQPERQRFETHFLPAPERRRKLRFGRALRKYMDLVGISESLEGHAAEYLPDEKPDVAKPPPKRGPLAFLPFSNPILSYSLAAVVVLIIFAFSWLALQNLRTPSRNPGNVLAVALEPGLNRDSGQIKKFTIPNNSDVVRFQLALSDDQYQSYETVLQDDVGQVLITKRDLKRQSDGRHSALIVDIPATLLRPGDYRIKLSGLTANGNPEDLGTYSFRVQNQ